MKGWLTSAICIISLITNLLLIILLIWINPLKKLQPVEYVVRDFSLEDYSWGIENFPVDTNIGEIKNANAAVKGAKKLWISKWGKVNGKTYDPTHGCPVEVFYNQETDCWLVQGTLPSGVSGSVPCAIFTSFGEVIAVWMN